MLLLICLMGLASSNVALLNTGQYCGSTSTYTYSVSGVTITPWPPTSGSTLSVTINGAFTSDTFLFGIEIDIMINNQESGGSFVNENGPFNKGQSQAFKFTTPAGTASGSYKVSFQLITTYSTPAACWQISYQL